MIPTLVYLRETSLLTDDQVRAYVAAQQIQFTRDFTPYWGLDAVCVFAATAYDIPEGAWPIILQDDCPDAEALAVHDNRGVPYAVVAVRGDPSWPRSSSHDSIEMRVDPTIERTIVIDGMEYALECADACEDDQFGYEIDGVPVSAFVTPAWFAVDGVAPFTFPKVPAIDRPLALAPGGYIGRRPVGGEWTQLMADEAGPRQAKRPSSRTLRRFTKAAA